MLGGPMSSQYIFTMYKLSRVHPPDKTVLRDISLSFYPGAKIGVLGLNGTGKSTLLRIMAGRDTEYRGEAQLAPGASVGLLEQEPQLDPSKDVRGNVEDGVRGLRDLLDRFNELAASYSEETADEFARLQDQIDAAGAWELDQMLDQAMDALRCPPGDADVASLSGGERRRVALARLLLSRPDLLLLDEPTNHLDAESVAWLERHLADYRGTIVAVTHDRYFLDNVAGWILELDRGHGIPFKGNYSSWLEQKQARLAVEEKQESARRRTIERELEWVRTNPKGRRVKARARLNRYEALLAEERNARIDDVQIHIPSGQRLGGKVIEADSVRKGFGDRLLIEDLSFSLPPAGIVGVIGANGAGKTTLFRLLLGLARPTAGTVEVGGIDVAKDPIGVRTRIGYMPEHECLPLDQTAADVVSTFGELGGLPVRAARQRASEVLDLVGLDEARFRPVGGFSTGMRQRTKLAQAIVADPRLVLLDEPTAGLDPSGREEMLALVARLGGFGIAVVLATHLLDDVAEVCDHVIMLDGGRLVTDAPTEALLQRTGTVTVDVGPAATSTLLRALTAKGLAVTLDAHGDTVEVTVSGDADLDDLRDVVAELGLPLYRLTNRLTSLDDVFVHPGSAA
jgi:sulfate-transporting ATPase